MRARRDIRLLLSAITAAFWIIQPGSSISAQAIPGAFSKLTPANAVTGQATTVLLQWGASSGATSYESCLDTTLDSACNGSWDDHGNAVGVVRQSLAAGATYEWQVRARNSNGVTNANAGTWWRFTTRVLPASTYFLDDLETAGTLGWGRVDPWDVSTQSAHSPTHAWSDSPGMYAPDTTATILSPPVDLRGAFRPQLSFWHRYDFAADGFDRGIVRITTNGGSSYTQLQSYTGSDVTWRKATFDLTPHAGAAALQIEFGIVSNGAQTGDGWYIDDIAVAETPLNFTDDPLVPGVTTVRTVHVSELRTRIDAVRTRVALPAFAWTDPILSALMPIRAQHILDLRAALLEAYSRAGRTPPTFTDSALIPAVTVIRAVHLQELRTAVVEIE